MKRIVKSKKKENEIYPNSVKTSRPIFIFKDDLHVGYVQMINGTFTLFVIGKERYHTNSPERAYLATVANELGYELWATNKDNSISKIVLHDGSTICESDVDYAGGVIVKELGKIVGIVTFNNRNIHSYRVRLITDSDIVVTNDTGVILQEVERHGYELYVK